MKIYLVGGAVRDQLLGQPVKDRDWLVVGASPEEMLALGYQQVGQNFPVFLHPQSKEEYALARREIKDGQGYQGFRCSFGPEVTLEEDLLRRDLTINALAQDEAGHIYDPYGGQRDLQQRILRHVSPAFVEDPLRVLRLCRFLARFGALGFTVAEETLGLARQLLYSGELATLTRERVWLELEKSLAAPRPDLFFRCFQTIAGDRWEYFQLFGLTFSEESFRAALERLRGCPDGVPQHRLALFLSASDLANFCKALPVPNDYQYWLKLVQEQAATARHYGQATAEERWRLFNRCQSLRAAGNLAELLRLLQLEGLWEELRPRQRELLAIDNQALMAQGFSGRALGEEIKRRQLEILA